MVSHMQCHCRCSANGALVPEPIMRKSRAPANMKPLEMGLRRVCLKMVKTPPKMRQDFEEKMMIHQSINLGLPSGKLT